MTKESVNELRSISMPFIISKGGVQWRLLPKDFPSWQLIYYSFRKWLLYGVWNKLQVALREMVREKHHKKACLSLGIIDSQSVKNSEWGIQNKGFDGNKKINGRKSHVVVDTLLLCIVVIQGLMYMIVLQQKQYLKG